MNAPVAVSIELGPSRIACVAIVAIAAGTFGVLLTVSLPAWVRLTAACALWIWAADRVDVIGRRRGPRAVRGIHLDDTDSIEVRFGDGRVIAGRLHRDSRAGPRLTSIVWQPTGARWSRSVLVLPDMLPADDFRRLRVLMRYGGSGG